MRCCIDRGIRAGAVVVPIGLGLVLAAMASGAGHTAFPDQPVPAHTGGFGEPTCHACHFDGALNPSGGALRVEGWPGRPVPGAAYDLVVRLEHGALARAGFQLAVRTAEGAQAGTLAPADARSAVTASGGVVYLHQTLAGTEPTAPAEAAWRFTWTAPDSSASGFGAALRLHVVGNAANGDASAFGDAVYADSLVAAAPGRTP